MMEKLKMKLTDDMNKKLDENLYNSMQDETFANLVKRLKLPKDIVRKNNSKLEDSCNELKNCNNCKGLFMCKNAVSGHVLYPNFENNTLKFIYTSCKYQKELNKKIQEKKESINEIENVRMKDIDINDKNRVEVIKWLKTFYDTYEKVNSLKGLYLHGSFGSGKTFLISALFNELKAKKDASIAIIYFPELLRTLKDDFTLVIEKLNYLEQVDLLLLDDIGAENVTAWGRDEILGTILQYRMNNKMPTFFTSNLNIEELETHFSLTKGSEDKVKARRIIERVKQLTEDKELISLNRRN